MPGTDPVRCERGGREGAGKSWDPYKALTYLRDQAGGGRLGYAELAEQAIPIGSGVTEAACKVLVKQRLCGPGMRWKEAGAAAELSVRCLTYTAGRWSQFWLRIDRDGFPVAA
jgi:hypothetical protein